MEGAVGGAVGGAEGGAKLPPFCLQALLYGRPLGSNMGHKAAV